MGFSLGSAEPQAKALHAAGRLKEENNMSCCTGLGRAHVLPWAGCQRGQGLPASLPASSRGSWHTAGVPVGPTAGRHACTARGSAGHILTLCLLVETSQLTSWSAGLCLPTTVAAQRPTGGTNVMGATKCRRNPTTIPLQESVAPSSTEGASPCSGLPARPVCSAAMPTPWAHPLPCLLG